MPSLAFTKVDIQVSDGRTLIVIIAIHTKNSVLDCSLRFEPFTICVRTYDD